MRYKVLGSATGRDLSRMACTSVKIDVFAPMPRAIVKTSVSVKRGAFVSWRYANFKSFMLKVSFGSLDVLKGTCPAIGHRKFFCDSKGLTTKVSGEMFRLANRLPEFEQDLNSSAR